MNKETIDAALVALSSHLQTIARQQDDSAKLMADLVRESTKVPWSTMAELDSRVKRLEAEIERMQRCV